MTDPKTKSAEETKTAFGSDPENCKGTLKHVGGSQSDHWNKTIVYQTTATLSAKHSSEEDQVRLVNAAFSAPIGIAPKDELESMMAAQLIAAHNAAMECYRRAMIGNQTFEGRRENLNQANKLSRTWATLLDALNKHRGKGQQKVTVEHVHVHAGGQAVVGTIERPGGGDQTESKELPHAKQITHAPEPALRGADAEGRPVPVARNEKRPMPNARGKVSGRANRE